MEKAVINTVEELKNLEISDAPPITELVVANFTEKLNNDEVKISQAAMHIREVIRSQTSLQRIFLQNNTFPAPELQFIIKAIIDKKSNASARPLLEINLGHTISDENLERSGRELRHLHKVYGDIIIFDNAVYLYFLKRYQKACEDYLEYLADDVIIPKNGETAANTSSNKLQLADQIIQENKGKKNKEKSKFNDAVAKYLLVRELYRILDNHSKPLDTLNAFHKQYKKIQKNLSATRNKKEAVHEQHFHAQVGDLKADSFNFPKKHPHSIFRALSKKKTRKKPAAGKRAAPKKDSPSSP